MTARSIIGDFGTTTAWQSQGGGPAPIGLAGGAYAFRPLGGAYSVKWLQVQADELYLVDYGVRLLKAPRNGKPARHVVGPLFLDSAGTVLSWGSVEHALVQKERESRVEAVPPQGAVRVHLFIGGMWSLENPQPDGIIAYTHAKLNVVGR